MTLLASSEADAHAARLQALIGYVRRLDCHVQQYARARQRELPALAIAPRALARPGPKYPASAFAYLEELDRPETEDVVTEVALLDEVARYFSGAIRPQSAHFLFNMVPEPSVEATAAAWLATAYNANSLMDAFGGEALLAEQRVARRIGRWAGWSQAMGVACNGGKLTIMYAIRSALSRIAPTSLRKGLPDDLVILCSEGSHYCVEHAASLLGLGADNCLRVAANNEGRMCANALQNTLDEQHARGRRIAAIICCGGTTINFNCEDTVEVRDIVENFVLRHGLTARPYLHLDSVIGWLYLSLRGTDEAGLVEQVPQIESRLRIAKVLERLRGLERFDSLGVDFHKNGLCPYASSFFIARDRRFMDELGDGDYRYSERDFHYGQFRAYRYTFENSRPCQGILAAWVSLMQSGRKGYAAYLGTLHAARNSLQQAIIRHGLFRVLNQTSLGWEVVFGVPFAEDLIAYSSEQALAVGFMQACWNRVDAGYDLPLFSIVPDYRINNAPDQVTTGFLLYPMRQRSDREWDETVELIAAQFHLFQDEFRRQPQASWAAFEKPIR